MIGAKVGQLSIKKKLGEGGMGAVYYAEHDVLRTPRAVKVLLPQWTQNETILQRFVNEARAAASIKHRSIIAVHDCGQLPDGHWFIVMDFLDGGTLTGFCASHGPLAPHVALQILAPTANGLEAAHAANIVHRDLKPDNIFLVQREDNPHHPIILDFGIAKLGENDGGVVTRSNVIAGTPAYMAPEQMRDLRVVDRRSDVYALGVIAYQMVTGGFPFEERGAPGGYGDVSAAEIYHRQMSQRPIDPRERVTGLPDRWAATILAALHTDPSRRPQTARAFALMLAEATPGDAFLQTGTDIVQTYARELLDIGNLLETVRASAKPASKPGLSKYQLGDQLGMGGMAEVFRGTMVGAEGFARPVAVKRVLSGFATIPQFASMFIEEARLAAKLSHPNIVQVIDFDRDADGRLFLVMEYVEGRDLSALVETGPRLPFSAIIFIVSEMLAGLAHAHELPVGGPIRGLVHRDISPHNVLLSWDGAVKVSDFGIAKARDASKVSASQSLKGKVQYMSPEQANGEALDGRSDLFAVGIVLYELLTGERLFVGTAQECIAQIMFRRIAPPSTLRPDTPADLEAVTMRLLERDRGARFPDAVAVIEELSRCTNTPRNGRLELQRLLAERFPNAPASRLSRPTVDANEPPRASTSPTAPARPPVEVITTLQSAAGHAAPRGTIARRWPLAVLGLGTAGATAVIVAVLANRGGAAPSREEQAGSALATRSVNSIDASRAAIDSAPELVDVVITTQPSGAIVSVDRRNLGPAPITVQARRGVTIAIDAHHDGFVAAHQSVVADPASREVTIVLAAQPTTVVDAGVATAPSSTPRPSPPIGSAAPARPTSPTRPTTPTRGEPGYNKDDIVGD